MNNVRMSLTVALSLMQKGVIVSIVPVVKGCSWLVTSEQLSSFVMGLLLKAAAKICAELAQRENKIRLEGEK